MASNSYSEKKKVMNNLINSMDKNTTSTGLLEREITLNTRATGELIKELDRANKSPQNINSGVFDKNFTTSLNKYLDSSLDHLETISNAVVSIKNYLHSSATEQRHRDNTNSFGSSIRGSSGGSDNTSSIGDDRFNKFMGVATSILSAIGASKIISRATQQIDDTIDTTGDIQGTTGINKEQMYYYKDQINSEYKGSSIYNINEEWQRQAQILGSIENDDMEQVIKYSKAVAEGVEGLNVSTSDMSELLFNIDRRGAFNKETLELITESVGKYASGTGAADASEIINYLKDPSKVMGSFVASGVLSEQEAEDQTALASRTFAALQDVGLTDTDTAKISSNIKDILDSGGSKSYLSSNNADLLNQLSMIGADVDAYMLAAREGRMGDIADMYAKDMMKYFGSLDVTTDIGIANATNALSFGGFDTGATTRNSMAVGLDKYLESYKNVDLNGKDTDDIVEDKNRKKTEEFYTKVENYLSNITDFFASKGIDSGIISLVGGIGAGLVSRKLFGKVFGKGATTSAGIAGTATAGASSRASNLLSSIFGKGVTTSAASTTASTGSRVANSALKGAGNMKYLKGAGKIAGKAAIPLALGVEAIETIGDYKNATTGEGKASAIGEGVGNAGGMLGGAAAGAALGTAIFPGVGTAIGGIIGGLAGNFAGGKLGEKAGSAIYNASKENKSVEDDFKPKAKTSNANKVTKKDVKDLTEIVEDVYKLLYAKFNEDAGVESSPDIVADLAISKANLIASSSTAEDYSSTGALAVTSAVQGLVSGLRAIKF